MTRTATLYNIKRQLTGCHLALVLAISALAGCSKSDTSKKRPLPLVATAHVGKKSVSLEARAPVDLRPLAQADIGSKTLGYLDAVLVDRGDRVKRGQVLALVRPSDLPDQLAAVRGTLAQTQASLSLARSNAERADALAPRGVVSQQELQQAKSAVATAEASQAAIQAQMAAIGVRLGETRIQSPLDGVVWSRRLDPGALVGQTGNTGAILTIMQTETLRVFLGITEKFATRVQIGQPAYVELDALPGERFSGKVVRLSPGLDSTTRTLDAEVRIDNAGGRLKPGMYGRGAIVLETHEGALSVPSSALQISNGQAFVFVVQGDTVHRRPVQIGVDEGTWVEVTGGLTHDEEIVTAGIEGISDKTKVRVAKNADPFAAQNKALDAKSTTDLPGLTDAGAH